MEEEAKFQGFGCAVQVIGDMIVGVAVLLVIWIMCGLAVSCTRARAGVEFAKIEAKKEEIKRDTKVKKENLAVEKESIAGGQSRSIGKVKEGKGGKGGKELRYLE